MSPDALAMLSDVQFILAQLLWEPRHDQDRALEIAKLAARTHPDPVRRAEIAAWLGKHTIPPVEEIAIEHPIADLEAVG